jgi:hypothetical protein
MLLNEYTIKILERKLSKLLNEELHIVNDPRKTNDEYVTFKDENGNEYTEKWEDLQWPDRFKRFMQMQSAAGMFAHENNIGMYGTQQSIDKDENGNEVYEPEDMSALKANGRIIDKESWYSNHVFKLLIPGVTDDVKPVKCVVRISNHLTNIGTHYRENCLRHNVYAVLNIKISKVPNRIPDLGVTDPNANRVIVIETDYNPDEKTEAQKIKMKNFLAAVHNGKYPLLTLKDIQNFIDPNAQVITAGGDIIKPNQYTDFRDVRSKIYRYRDRQAEENERKAREQERKAKKAPVWFDDLLDFDMIDSPYNDIAKSKGYDFAIELPDGRIAAFMYGAHNPNGVRKKTGGREIVIKPGKNYAVPFKQNGRGLEDPSENAIWIYESKSELDESRKRGKNVIRITEEDLRRIIRKCVNEQLRRSTLY